nr:hypothetical protein [Tanacetum cinerariifolium]
MSTPVFVDLEISTQANGAQSSRVLVPLPEDPYDAIRRAYLESNGSSTSSARSMPSNSTAPLSPDHLLTHTTPDLVPILCRTRSVRGLGLFKIVHHRRPFQSRRGIEGLVAGDEGLGMGVESYGSDDESHGLDDEDHRVESDGLGLGEEEEAVPEGDGTVSDIIGDEMGEGTIEGAGEIGNKPDDHSGNSGV